MVDFRLTDDAKALRELAHDFAVREMRPVAWEYDRDSTWPEEVLRKAWELGLMNIHTPEEYGGVALSAFDGVVLQEELAWGCSGIQTSLGANGLAAAPILIAGSDEIKREYLTMMTEEFKLSSFALTEPDAGSDVSGMRTASGASGRRVRHQRLEVLHHQRRARRLVHGLRQDRPRRRQPRDLRVRRPQGRHGHGGQEGRQDGAAGLQHRDHHVQRDGRPGAQPPRRGEQGLSDRDGDARHDAAGHRRDGGRDRARGVRVRVRLREGARPVRRADRDAPGRSSS